MRMICVSKRKLRIVDIMQTHILFVFIGENHAKVYHVMFIERNRSGNKNA
jgi:hypothetical protein